MKKPNPLLWILRHCAFYALLIPVTFILPVLVTILFFLPFRWRYSIVHIWSFYFIWLAKTFLLLNYRVTGLEHLPKRACVVIANHQSTWETIFLPNLLPMQSWVVKRELYWIPLFGWGLKLMKPIAINRSKAGTIPQIIRQGSDMLANGRWVVIFPQGTRVAPGKHKRFAKGGTILAQAAHAPIVPIAHNAGVFWPRGPIVDKPGTIEVVIGPTIYPNGEEAAVINQKVAQWLENTLQTLPHH